MTGPATVPSTPRTVLAGLAGGVALNLGMLLTFRLLGFGWNGGGILLDPSIQSPKLIAVWTRLEPLPLVVSGRVGFVTGASSGTGAAERPPRRAP